MATGSFFFPPQIHTHKTPEKPHSQPTQLVPLLLGLHLRLDLFSPGLYWSGLVFSGLVRSFWCLGGLLQGLEGSSGPLGPSWGRLGGLLVPLGGSWEPLGPLLGPLGGLLGRSWDLLGSSWEALGASWGPLGSLLGASWAQLGRSSVPLALKK